MMHAYVHPFIYSAGLIDWCVTHYNHRNRHTYCKVWMTWERSQVPGNEARSKEMAACINVTCHPYQTNWQSVQISRHQYQTNPCHKTGCQSVSHIQVCSRLLQAIQLHDMGMNPRIYMNSSRVLVPFHLSSMYVYHRVFLYGKCFSIQWNDVYSSLALHSWETDCSP